MAYFWEEQLNANSNHMQRWPSRLEPYLAQFPTDREKFQIWLVAAINEIESAMLIDLAYDLRRTTISHRIVEVDLFGMLISVGGDGQYATGEDENTVRNRRFAAIRELLRYQSNSRQVSDRTRTEINLLNGSPFSRIFFYDQPQSITGLPDQWVVLMDEAVRTELATNNIIPPILQPGSLFYTTISCHNYLLPVEEIRRYCTARLAYDIFFSKSNGATAVAGLFPLDDNSRRPEFSRLDEPFENAANRLLTESSTSYPGAANAMAAISAAARGTYISHQQVELPRDLEAAFQDRLETFFEREMNLRGAATIGKEPTNAVLWAQDVLNALTRILRSSEYVLLQNAARNDALAGRVASALPRLVAQARYCLEELQVWEEKLLQRIVPDLAARQKIAARRLQELMEDHATRTIVAGSGQASQLPGEEIYQDKLNIPDGKRAVESLRRLPYWKWNRDNTGRSYLSISLNSETEQTPPLVAASDPESFLNCLEAAAYRRADKFVSNLSISRQLVLSGHRPGEDEMSPLLNQRPVANAHHLTSGIIVGQRNTDLDNWLSTSTVPNTQNKLIEIDDPGRVTFLHIDANLTLENSVTLWHDLSIYRSNPRLHIFIQEQRAAQVEADMDRLRGRFADGWRGWNPLFDRNYHFSPTFTRFLFNPTAFDTLIGLVFFNRLRKEDGWKIFREPGIHFQADVMDQGGGETRGQMIPIIDRYVQAEGIRPPQRSEGQVLVDLHIGRNESLEQVLERIFFDIHNDVYNSQHPLFRSNFASTLDGLNQEMDQYWKQNPKSHDLLLRNLEKHMRLWEGGDIFQRDLAVYLKYLACKIAA